MTSLDLYGAAFRTDPYAELARLRDLSWHAQTAIGTAVLRHAEVQQLLQLRELRTPGADFLALQGITDGLLVDTMRGFLLNTDGDDHARVRRLVSGAFTTRRVEAFRPVVAGIAAELVSALAATDRCDFVRDFAQPFALRVLHTFVGIPLSADVQQWTSDVGLLFGMDVVANGDRITTAIAHLDAFLDDLLAQRRAVPRDDLLSALVTDGRLTDVELRSMVVTLMSAGQGTVQHQLGNAMATFLANPEQWRLLGDRPDLAARTAEEVVRYCPSALLGVPRIAKSDVTINGLLFRAGSCVLPVTGAANRDPLTFPAAATFDITRSGAPHLTYGGGIHFCLGAALARVELQESLPRLAAALRAPRPDGPAEWLPPTEAVYGPTRLPIAYSTD
ncbi:cytochrome P450 [Dactylosporangium siamense]|uniref:Cytochrome P450 n=1 Tax=Dactylosporangium siamense TaxID=685454 RepID=A0A919PU78_9ACTN|nr:cytochrome P450 [Dactylosporangium siamense]GIG50626.1 cytochrome P450 [Dactylosporangium siamense]